MDANKSLYTKDITMISTSYYIKIYKRAIMDVSIKKTGVFGIVVKASGRLDLDAAVEYGKAIKDAIYDSEESISEITLDFSEITFISSFGLKVILDLYKDMKENNGTLKIQNTTEQIFNSFKIVGFDKFLVFI